MAKAERRAPNREKPEAELMPTTERRSQKRTPLQLPVKVRPPEGPELSAQTRDLSSSGIFLYSDSAMAPGAKLELVIMLPPGLGLGPGGWTLCQASVVRVEKLDGQGVGVAATFDCVELLPELT